MTVKFKPDHYHSITPYLTVVGADRLIAFLKDALDGEVIEQLLRPDESINHAEVQIGDSIVMLGEAENEADAGPSTLYLYVPDSDRTYQRALDASATSIMEPTDMFYGDRNAAIVDP